MYPELSLVHKWHWPREERGLALQTRGEQEQKHPRGTLLCRVGTAPGAGSREGERSRAGPGASQPEGVVSSAEGVVPSPGALRDRSLARLSCEGQGSLQSAC